MSEARTSRFQRAIETVEGLPVEDQVILIEIIRKHLVGQRRNQLAEEIAESRAAYDRGEVTRGGAEDLMKELTE